jgi:hypothetical protein
MGSGTRALDQYLQQVKLGRDRFVADNPWLFVVRVAPATSPTDNPWADDISFATRVPGMESGDDDDDDESTAEIGWVIAPIKKREGGPFPERIGVGRARNCDVVLRFPTISKLHAQFHLGQPMRLVDLDSANGTKLNGEPLVPRKPRPVALGDRVEFGAVELRIHDAAGLYKLLTG